MDVYDLLGVVTALLMMVFIGIVVWAYSARRKADFDEAALLPLDDPAAYKRESRAGGRRS